MALYRYKVINSQGQKSEELIEADSSDEALNRLRLQGFSPLVFLGEATANRIKIFSKNRFNVYRFTNRLAPLLKAHIRLEKSLAIMGKREEIPENKKVINELRKGLHEGKKFSELIRRHGSRFPRLYGNLIEAGEQTGNLSIVVSELQRFLNQSKEQRDFLITSSIYPIVILLVTFVVIVLMFTVFIPRFSKIFLDMGKELPLPTEIMLTTSRWINNLLPLWIAVFIGVVFLIIKIRQGGKLRMKFDKFILKLPIAGKLMQTIEISRFTRTMAIMLGNHVPILEAIRIGSNVINNSEINNKFSSLQNQIRAGNRFSTALESCQYVPSEVIQMLEVGEESGEVGEMLAEVASEQEMQVKVEIKRLLALFEPVVIVVLALVILMVVLSIFLAVMEMNKVT